MISRAWAVRLDGDAGPAHPSGAVVPTRALVIGVGNADRGDDAAGLLVARRVREIAGGRCHVVECTGALTDLLGVWARGDRVVVVDAMQGSHPGRWHRVDARGAESLAGTASSHGLGVGELIGLARALDMLPQSLVVYAVEGNDFRHGAPVQASILAAVGGVAEHVVAEVV